MALTLDQYATYLDSRDVPWPSPPKIQRPKARPYLFRLVNVRAVTWNVYGTVLAIAGGDLLFEHPQQLVMDIALDKTIQEFKMWGSMTRKPGQPKDYLRQVYTGLLRQHQTLPGSGEKYPEVIAERLWEAFIKKLMQKDFHFDAGFYGSLNEFSRKVAYFFHASLQGITAFRGAAKALRHVAGCGLYQGLLGQGQCFTLIQLQRCLTSQDPDVKLDELLDPELCTLSHEVRARQPSERLFRRALTSLADKGIAPDQVLHIGSRISLDVVPARRLGMKTGLFAGDKAALEATAAQLKEPQSRPDVLLTELPQIAEIVRSS
jgi:hypothetical protein